MKLKKAFLVFTIILVFCSMSYMVFAAQSTIAYCDGQAQLSIKKTGYSGNVHARLPNGEWFPVLGIWEKEGRKMAFFSDHAVLSSRAVYDIKIVDGAGYQTGFAKVTCPGLKFTCKFMNLDLKKCELKGEEYFLEFNADNIIGPEDLSYFFETESGKVYDRTPKSESTGLDFLVVPLSEDTYMAIFKSRKEPLRTVYVSHELCDEKDDLYYTMQSIRCDVNKCSDDDDCKSVEYCDKRDLFCKPLDCDYCTHEHACFDYGDGMSFGELPYFCNENGLWQSKKKGGEACENTFECVDMCENSLCMKPVVKERPEKNESVIMLVVEEPSTPLFLIIPLILTVLIIGALALSIIYGLPLIGRFALDLEKNQKDTLLRKINNYLDRQMLKDKAKLKT